VFWMHTTGCVSKREEKAFSLSLLFVLIPHYKPCEKRLLYPLVKKLPTGQLIQLSRIKIHRFTFLSAVCMYTVLYLVPSCNSPLIPDGTRTVGGRRFKRWKTASRKYCLFLAIDAIVRAQQFQAQCLNDRLFPREQWMQDRSCQSYACGRSQ
jgi:hypothetical protein